MEAKKEDIKIYGKLVNVTTENVVADAEQIWDSYYRKNQTAVNRSMRDDFTKFAKNPTFESAVFTGDSTFQALNIDTKNLVVHNLLKVENGGSFRVDGDTILNNLSVSGTLDVPNATTGKYGSVRLAASPSGQASTDVLTVGLVKDMLQYVLPASSENNILIYSNGKWITSAIDQVINSNTTINEHIKSVTQNTSYTKNEVYTKSQTYSKAEVTQLLQDLKESILKEYNGDSLWQPSGKEYIIPKDGKKIKVNAAYKNVIS